MALTDGKASPASPQTCCECEATPKTRQVLQAGSEYHLNVTYLSFRHGFGLPIIHFTWPVALRVMCGILTFRHRASSI